MDEEREKYELKRINPSTVDYFKNGKKIYSYSIFDLLGPTEDSWTQYNENGLVICEKDCNGNEALFEYDNKGNLITETHYGEQNFQYEYKYDDKGNCIYSKNNKGEESYREFKYNDDGKKIYEKNQFGKVTIYKYNDRGLLISEHYDDGTSCLYQYDDDDRIVYINNAGWERWYVFDESGNEVYCKTKNDPLYSHSFIPLSSLFSSLFSSKPLKGPGDSESWSKYDKNGNLIYCINSDGNEHFYKYDSNGNLIYYKNHKGKEKYFKEEYIEPFTFRY